MFSPGLKPQFLRYPACNPIIVPSMLPWLWICNDWNAVWYICFTDQVAQFIRQRLMLQFISYKFYSAETFALFWIIMNAYFTSYVTSFPPDKITFLWLSITETLALILQYMVSDECYITFLARLHIGHSMLTHSNINFLRKKWFQDRFIT